MAIRGKEMRILKVQMVAVVVISVLLTAACSEKGVHDGDVFTLYSNAPSDQFARLHEATFDAHYGSEFNSAKCESVQRLLQEWYNTETKTNDVKFWCEKGRYKK